MDPNFPDKLEYVWVDCRAPDWQLLFRTGDSPKLVEPPEWLSHSSASDIRGIHKNPEPRSRSPKPFAFERVHSPSPSPRPRQQKSSDCLYPSPLRERNELNKKKDHMPMKRVTRVSLLDDAMHRLEESERIGCSLADRLTVIHKKLNPSYNERLFSYGICNFYRVD
jgi:hypothetical protein